VIKGKPGSLKREAANPCSRSGFAIKQVCHGCGKSAAQRMWNKFMGMDQN